MRKQHINQFSLHKIINKVANTRHTVRVGLLRDVNVTEANSKLVLFVDICAFYVSARTRA